MGSNGKDSRDNAEAEVGAVKATAELMVAKTAETMWRQR